MLFKLKTGMGKHRIRRNGRMVVLKPGDKIDCECDELGGAIDKFEQLEPDPPPPEPKLGLRAVHCGHGKWNVINEATGVKISDKPLTKEEALNLVSFPPKESEFWLDTRKDGLFDVVDNVTGKPVNEEPLKSVEEAKDLVEKIIKEEKEKESPEKPHLKSQRVKDG